MIDKWKFRMPFKYFRDRDTINFERNQPEMVDPVNAHKILSWKGPDGKSYLLNNKNRAYFTSQGILKPPYFQLDDYMDKLSGHDAFVFCPGPSMGEVDLSLFDGKMVFAANSAGFKVKNAPYWVAMESNWILWLKGEKKIPTDRTWIMSSRCAIRWRGLGLTPNVKSVYVARFEDDWRMPHRTPAVCTMGALFAAWWLGAKRVFILGMDLSRPGKVPYVKGVPYSDYGASNPFDEQLVALRQFSIPEFEVFNASPHSQSKVPFNKISYKEIESIAKDAPPCPTLDSL